MQPFDPQSHLKKSNIVSLVLSLSVINFINIIFYLFIDVIVQDSLKANTLYKTVTPLVFNKSPAKPVLILMSSHPLLLIRISVTPLMWVLSVMTWCVEGERCKNSRISSPDEVTSQESSSLS
jgi:hypothetical protein